MNEAERPASNKTVKTNSKHVLENHMKTIVKTALILAIMSLMPALQAEAQRAGAPNGAGIQQGAGLQIAFLFSDDLALSEDQKMKVGDLIANHRSEMRSYRQARDPQRRAERREARPDRQQALMDEIQAILTPAQWEKYKALQQDMQDNRIEVQEFVMKSQAASIADEIGLSAGKKSQVLELVSAHLAETRNLRAAGAGRAQDIDTRIERLELMRDFRAAIQGVLTEEEFQAWSNEWQSLMPAWNRDAEQKGRRPARGDRRVGRGQ
jgi:hypothetical protein